MGFPYPNPREIGNQELDQICDVERVASMWKVISGDETEACGAIATVSIQERRAKRDPCMGDGIEGLAGRVWGK